MPTTRQAPTVATQDAGTPSRPRRVGGHGPLHARPFTLERYFANYEFSAPYLLSSSDPEPVRATDLLAKADDDVRGLYDRLSLGYTESQGHPLLRHEIALQYAGLDASTVQVAAPQEAILLASMAIAEPGKSCVVTFPCFQSLYEIPASLGAEVRPWIPREEGRWRFDLGDLERLVDKDTNALVVNFPHNPTGAHLSRKEWDDLVTFAQDRDLWLVSDESFRFMEHEDGHLLPSACEVYEKALTLGSLSKNLGMAGLRIGWLATTNRPLVERISRLHDYTTICNSAPSEVLAVAALRARDHFLDAQRSRLRRNVKTVHDVARRSDLPLEWSLPTAGTTALVRLQSPRSAERFCDEVVRGAGIMTLPSTVFEFGDRHVRIGFGRENFGDVVARFAAHLERHPNTGRPT